jgi:hypothetical protein
LRLFQGEAALDGLVRVTVEKVSRNFVSLGHRSFLSWSGLH